MNIGPTYIESLALAQSQAKRSRHYRYVWFADGQWRVTADHPPASIGPEYARVRPDGRIEVKG